MDPQPKALRPYVLLTTAFVLFGAMAGYALFLQQRTPPPPEAAPVVDEATLDAVVIRPMSPPASVDGPTRARIERLVKGVLTGESGPDRRAAGEGLLDVGAAAVPSLLDAIGRMATAPHAFEDPDGRSKLTAPDTVLKRMRAALTPGTPADPFRRAPDAGWCVRRVKSWFLWWDEYVSSHPEWR